MVQADPIDRLMRAALASDEEFVQTLNDLLRRDLRISIRELSESSGIAQSSLYKLLHGQRSPNLSTLRAIIRAMRRFYHVGEGEFIGLIVARPVLATTEERTAEVDAQRVRIRDTRSTPGRMPSSRRSGQSGTARSPLSAPPLYRGSSSSSSASRSQPSSPATRSSGPLRLQRARRGFNPSVTNTTVTIEG